MMLFLLTLSCAMRNSKIASDSSLSEFVILESLLSEGNLAEIHPFLNKARDKNTQQILLKSTTKFLALEGRQNSNIQYLYWAKQYGLQCLQQDPNFTALVEAQQGRVSTQAIEALNEQNPLNLECAQWLLIGWSLWLDYRGAVGVGSDIEILHSLGDWVIRFMDNSFVEESFVELNWAWYGYALSQSLGESYYSVDWLQVAKAFKEAGEIDDLMRFEAQYYYTRFVNVDAYCAYSNLGDLSEEVLRRWQASQYLCQ